MTERRQFPSGDCLLLRDYMPRGFIDAVPFLFCKAHIIGFRNFFETRGVCRTDDGLHAGRMPQYPGYRRRTFRDAMSFADRFQLFIENLIFRIVREDAVKIAVMERGPCLQSDIIETHIIQEPAVPVGCPREWCVGLQSAADDFRLCRTELHLVCDQLLIGVSLYIVELHGVEIAQAEVPYLSRLFQPVECFRNFSGVHQGVRSVEHEQVEVIGAEALEDAIDGIDDMFFGQVIVFNVLSRSMAVSYAAFALKDDVLTP